MNILTRLFKDTTSRADIVVAFVLIILIGLASNLLVANRNDQNDKGGTAQGSQRSGMAKNTEPTVIATAPVKGQSMPSSNEAQLFSADMVFEDLHGERCIRGKALLKKIEVVNPNQVPDQEFLGSYTNSAGGIGMQILRNGRGKAFKMTFVYQNVGDAPAKYDSGWRLQGPELEKIIASYGDTQFTYAYGQVPIWNKISTDPIFFESHLLKPGHTVTETVWFSPCPPVKKCLIGDFELPQAIEIRLP
ncbi:MAG: hypothetical protein ACYC56_08660 [Candidatus Aquicultor sp.]